MDQLIFWTLPVSWSWLLSYEWTWSWSRFLTTLAFTYSCSCDWTRTIPSNPLIACAWKLSICFMFIGRNDTSGNYIGSTLIPLKRFFVWQTLWWMSTEFSYRKHQSAKFCHLKMVSSTSDNERKKPAKATIFVSETVFLDG